MSYLDDDDIKRIADSMIRDMHEADLCDECKAMILLTALCTVIYEADMSDGERINLCMKCAGTLTEGVGYLIKEAEKNIRESN